MVFCFFVVAALIFGVVTVNVPFLDRFFNTTIGQLMANGLIYVLVLFVVVLPIWKRGNFAYVREILGVRKKPGREIIWLPFVTWGIYMAATIVASILVSRLPWVDVNQPQETGFENLTQPLEYVVAFVALVILPPLAEELLFRGYLFGRLRAKFGFVLSAIVTSVVFGFVHLQWNVGIDVAILSMFLCYLRERTGSIWAGVVLHAIKNGVAYTLLFIAPLLGANIQ